MTWVHSRNVCELVRIHIFVIQALQAKLLVVARGQIGRSATLEDVSQREWVRPGGVGGLHGGTLTEPGVHVHGRATSGGFTGECPRAPLSPNPSSPIFAGRAHPKARRFDTHRPPPSQLIAKDASQRGATAAAEALRHAGELSDEEGYHQEERKKPSFGRLLVRVPNLEPEH